MKVLITGIAGNIGRLVTQRLLDHGHEVIGIDRRPWYHPPEGVRVFQHDIRKRPAEDVFRTQRPDAMVHMATVTHLTHRSEDRFRINLGGTRAVFDHCNTYGVKQAIFVGRHTYYGAAPDSALYHTEAEPPMAVHTFPELSDLVAADLYAGSALWRYPNVDTAVLRMCYTLGPLRQGTLAAFLRGPRVPTVMGFDPLFQFMHELDTAEAICTALDKGLRGVFNVAGPPPVPLSVVIQQAGLVNVPIPELLFSLALGRFGLPKLPRGALAHVKHPVVMDSSAFQEATGWKPAHDEDATLLAFRTAES
ncbi:MAG: NAD-dependent epimerase/dehydratase family protein [Deltaproteobacteria bacterium]|nr:NAD-dependent epimerase/dehydratase family protein [Deltaproteobacteria bacterium]